MIIVFIFVLLFAVIFFLLATVFMVATANFKEADLPEFDDDLLTTRTSDESHTI